MSQITFKSNPMTLNNELIKVGDKAPEFQVVDGTLAPKKLSDYDGKIKVIATFPSIDTPVCQMQVREFNKRAAGFSDEVVVLGISKDLPFAQARFCGAEGIEGVHTLSDYQSSSFSLNYGLHINELALTARSVLILDKDNVVRYFDLVKEQTDQPDYEAAVKALEKIV